MNKFHDVTFDFSFCYAETLLISSNTKHITSPPPPSHFMYALKLNSVEAEENHFFHYIPTSIIVRILCTACSGMLLMY